MRACFSARRPEARKRPELGRESAHACAVSGHRRPRLSESCGVLAGGAGGAWTAARLRAEKGVFAAIGTASRLAAAEERK